MLQFYLNNIKDRKSKFYAFCRLRAEMEAIFN